MSSVALSIPVILLPGEVKPIVVVDENNLSQTDHPILNQASRKVTFPLDRDPEAAKTIVDLLATAEKLDGMAGLAAPQIGKNLQIFIHQISDEGKLADRIVVVINPQLTDFSAEKEKGVEGCFSIPGYTGFVSRHVTLKVTYYNWAGNLIEKDIPNPFLARVFQHEGDHLLGILYPQRMEVLDQLIEIKEES